MPVTDQDIQDLRSADTDLRRDVDAATDRLGVIEPFLDVVRDTMHTLTRTTRAIVDQVRVGAIPVPICLLLGAIAGLVAAWIDWNANVSTDPSTVQTGTNSTETTIAHLLSNHSWLGATLAFVVAFGVVAGVLLVLEKKIRVPEDENQTNEEDDEEERPPPPSQSRRSRRRTQQQAQQTKQQPQPVPAP